MSKPLILAPLLACVILSNCSQEQHPKVCSVHNKAIESMVGYYPSKNMMVSPDWDIVRYGSGVEDLYPHRIPWAVSQNKSKYSNRKSTVYYCADCDEEFSAGYAAFKELPESEKERLFVKALDKNPAPE